MKYNAHDERFMRVLLVGPAPFPPNGPAGGGVSAAIRALAEGMARLGVAVTVVSPGPARAEFQSEGVKYVFVQSRGRTILRANLLVRVRQLRRRHQYDIVNVHGSAILAFLAGPALLTVHGLPLERTSGNPARRFLSWLYVRVERTLINRWVPCLMVSPFLLAEYPSARVIATIPNAVEDRFFETVRRPEHGRVLYGGNVTRAKGIDVLEEALSHTERVRCLVVTGPNDGSTLSKSLGLYGQIRVEQLGPVSSEQFAHQLSRCQVLVLPSRAEVAPMVIAEAHASGVPTVVTDVGGCRHMTPTSVGRVVPPGQPVALAEALDDVIERARIRHADEIRRFALSRYSQTSVATATIEAYRTHAVSATGHQGARRPLPRRAGKRERGASK